jgi:hypothetical protein
MSYLLVVIPFPVGVVLMLALSRKGHSAPQSYYLKKERGATIALDEYKADPDWRAIREEGRL